MMRSRLLCLAAVLVTFAGAACAAPFDGAGDNQIADQGYYYMITGGKMPDGQTINGDNGSGGTFRYLVDDPVWGKTTGVWLKDDWFPQNVSMALTMKNVSSIVFDNNGLEDSSYGSYYNGQAQGATDSNTVPGLYRGYSMSNNYDWIYAGYFKLTEATTVTELIGYFDAVGGFDPDNPIWQYNFNIWSNADGDLLPVNTGSFAGNIFSSSTTSGSFTTSDTGVDRVFGSDYGNATDDILRLSYKLDTPLTLAAGEYWFSHDASINPIPEPVFFQMGALLGMGGLGMLRLRKRA